MNIELRSFNVRITAIIRLLNLENVQKGLDRNIGSRGSIIMGMKISPIIFKGVNTMTVQKLKVANEGDVSEVNT